MSWQYWNSAIIYAGVGILTLPLMLKYRLTPYHLIFTNPVLPYGGMEIGSKFEVLERLRGHPAFLQHLILKPSIGVTENIRRFETFMGSFGLEYPVIAKPDLGCVGFGVRKVRSAVELAQILARSPVGYLVQEFCDLPKEYSIFFVRLPEEKRGIVPSLTEKEIPSVTGDGKLSIGELIKQERRYDHNRKALLTHVQNLERIPNPGETIDLLVQASHTYGTLFFDRCFWIDSDLERWMNRLCEDIPGFNFIRLDLKASSRESLKTGEGIKIMEINGCMSEPIHIYDPRHRFRFGVREFYRFYDMAFRIARFNVPDGERPPYRLMNKAYLRFFRNKKKIMDEIG